MLQWTRIQLPLSGPLDQATDPKIVDPTKAVASLVNATYNHDGAISKAHGWDAIAYTTPAGNPGVSVGEALVHSMVSDGQRIYIGALHNIDPLVGNDYYASDYFQAMHLASNDVVAGVGSWFPIKVSRQETARLTYLGGAFQNVCSVVSAGGFLWTAWNDNGTAYYQVTDETTGVIVKTRTALWKPGAWNVYDLRVVALTDYVHIFTDYGNASPTFLIGAVLSVADPTAAAVTAQITNTKDPDIGWDACYFNNGAVESAILVHYYGISDRVYLTQHTNSPVPDAIDFDDTITAWDGPLACCYHRNLADHYIAIAYQHDNAGAAGGIRVRTFDDGLGLDAASADMMAVGTIGGTVTRLAISTEIPGSGVAAGLSEVTVWLEVTRDDSTAAVKAEFDFSTQCTNIDTVIEAHTAGYDGNRIQVSLVGDSPLAGGVTISRFGRSVVIHFEAGVSVRADVVTAIAALAGADDIIDVKTAGVDAGVLTVAADSMSAKLLDGGQDDTNLQTYRVRPIKVYRTPVPTLLLDGIGSAWENCKITSRAVYFKQRSHCWLHYYSTEWPLMALVTTGEYNATLSVWERITEAFCEQGRSVPRGYYSLASAWDDGDRIWAGTTVTNDDDTKSIEAVCADFGMTGLHGAALGGSTIVGGGQLCTLDGRCMPHGFAHHPEVARSLNYHTGGGLLEGATYKYLALYEWTDARGLVHRSAPSLPYEITLPYLMDLAGLGTTIVAGSNSIKYVLDYYVNGIHSISHHEILLTAGAYTDPQDLADQVNINLAGAVPPAPFRLLAGNNLTVGTIDYVPTDTSKYQFVLRSDVAVYWCSLVELDTAASIGATLGFDADTYKANGVPTVMTYSPEMQDYYQATSGFVSPPVSFITEGFTETSLVRLDIRNLILGDEDRNTGEVRICLFRTLADGTEYYLVDTMANNPAAAWQTYQDAETDLSISENRMPYTTGEPNDVLENAHPVGHILWTHGDRFCIVDNEDPRRVWISKPIAVGVAPEFSYELQIVMPEAIVAGLSLGAYNVLFSSRRCWAIGGDGPNALGVGDWLAPRLLSSDNGAVDYRGVCEIEGGAIVLGARGLYAIQGGSVQPIGREVQDLIEGADVRAIISRRDDREVWIFCEPSTGGDGYVVVFDYERSRWSKRTWGDAAAAVEHDGLISFGTVTGLLRVEAPADWDYGGTGYTMQVETGWFKLGGLAGYQRVRRAHLIGTWIGSCSVAVEVFVDYSSTAIQTVTIPLLAQPSPDFLARFVPRVQKCAAIKFRVTVTATPAAPEKRGIDLHAIELEIGTKGAYRRSAVSK